MLIDPVWQRNQELTIGQKRKSRREQLYSATVNCWMLETEDCYNVFSQTRIELVPMPLSWAYASVDCHTVLVNCGVERNVRHKHEVSVNGTWRVFMHHVRKDLNAVLSQASI